MTEPLTRLLLVLALIGLLGAVLAVPATRYGDASEYVMAAMSVVSDGDLVYEEKDLTRAVAGRPEGTDIPAGLQLVQTGDGVYHFGGHTIYYPALAAPLYAVFGYRGFYILNALLFWAVLVVVAYHYGPGAGFPVALVALVPSAALCYVFWTTPETAILCFLALSLFSWAKGRSFLSGMALGVASAMKFPLALFVVALLAGGRERRSRRSGGLFVAGFLLLFLPQVAYNVVSLNCVHATFLTSSDSSTFMYFRTRVPYCEGFRPTKDVRVMHRWTDASHLSAERVVASLIDPSMGLVWFYPMALYCLAVSPWRRRHLALMAVFLVCLATFCSVQRLFTHQVGLRALNYLYPVLLFLPDRARVRGAVPRLLMGWAVLWGATFAVFPLSNSIDQVDRKPLPAYRAWVSVRERLDRQFFLERHLLAPGFAASNTYADGWTVGGRAAAIVCVVPEGAADVELTIRAADKPWQHVEWEGGGARGELVLRGGGNAVIRVPVPHGQRLPRVTISAEGFCPSGADVRSLGVRILRARAGGEIIFEATRG
jgi:hypothetical protein